MKTLHCRDCLVADCAFVAKGETDQELVRNMETHLHTVHADLYSTDFPESLEERRQRMIKHILIEEP